MVAPGGHAWSLPGGYAWLLWGVVCVVAPRGGMRGCSRGACMVASGGMCGCSRGAWLLWGACVVARGGACVVAHGGACMVAPGGMRGCSQGGHAWLLRVGGVHGFFDEIRSMSGRYASHWNAFSLYFTFFNISHKFTPMVNYESISVHPRILSSSKKT